MALRTTIQRDLTEAARARDKLRLSTLRMLLAAVKNREIALRRELTEGELIDTVGKLVGQRHDASEQFRRGGRPDLADKEEAEARLLAAYLPQPLEPAELATRVDEAIARVGATSRKDMGKVMKLLLPELAGRADSRAVSQLVQERLRALGG